MEQDVDMGFSAVCSTCLSSNRHVFPINNITQVYKIFRLIMEDFVSEDNLDEPVQEIQLICWECMAMMKKFAKFKRQVHFAQEHIRVLPFSKLQENTDHAYISQSLSSLAIERKTDYDKIYFDYLLNGRDDHQNSAVPVSSQKIKNKLGIYDVIQSVIDNVQMNNNTSDGEFYNDLVPEIILGNSTDGEISHTNDNCQDDVFKIEPFSQSTNNEPKDNNKHQEKSKCDTDQKINVKTDVQVKSGYFTEYMTEKEMLASREEAKQKLEYVSSAYKCELCIIGFDTRKQLEDHLLSMHKNKPGYTACRVCYVCVDEANLHYHVNNHYFKYICQLCGLVEYNGRTARHHAKSHLVIETRDVIGAVVAKPTDNAVRGGNAKPAARKTRKRKKKTVKKSTVTAEKNTNDDVDDYKCQECDMVFKSTKARSRHAARSHKRGLPCSQCKKRFANKHTLTTHLRLHDAPIPKQECPICHKMIQVIIMKYHIERHKSKVQHECKECDLKFTHMKSYWSHMNFSKVHSNGKKKKYPCSMCDKGFSTEEAMQDHLNYRHLGKTAHKCPVCDKPLASSKMVQNHMKRLHVEKKDAPRKNYPCKTCGKSFLIKKSLSEHELSHTGERPLSCELCSQTFRQKAALYTHKRRVHKMAKRVLEYIDAEKPSSDHKPAHGNPISVHLEAVNGTSDTGI